MQKILSWIISIPLTIFAVSFAALNVSKVKVILLPGADVVEAPLSLVALGLMGVGFLCGALIVFLQSTKVMSVKRSEARKAAGFQKEVDRLRGELHANGHYEPVRKKPKLSLTSR